MDIIRRIKQELGSVEMRARVKTLHSMRDSGSTGNVPECVLEPERVRGAADRVNASLMAGEKHRGTERASPEAERTAALPVHAAAATCNGVPRYRRDFPPMG